MLVEFMHVGIYAQILLALTLGCLGALWLSRGFSRWKEKKRLDKALGIASIAGSCGVLIVGLGDINSFGEDQERADMGWLIFVFSFLWFASLFKGIFLCHFLNTLYLVSVERFLSILGASLFCVWMIFNDQALDISDIFISLGLIFWLAVMAIKNFKMGKA